MRIIHEFVFLALASIVSVVAYAQAPAITGKVVDIGDGESLTVLDEAGATHRVRLAGIDAPERGQPGWHRSKDALSALALEQPVRVVVTERGPGNQVIGSVWVAAPDSACRRSPSCPMALDAGLAQIRAGRAWALRAPVQAGTAAGEASYDLAEQQARATGAGLWRSGAAEPPWEWRRRRTAK